jgi:hypothetical protein
MTKRFWGQVSLLFLDERTGPRERSPVNILGLMAMKE